MMVTSAKKTVIEMRRIFATHGLPCQIISENGHNSLHFICIEFLKQNVVSTSTQSQTIQPQMKKQNTLFKPSNMPERQQNAIQGPLRPN